MGTADDSGRYAALVVHGDEQIPRIWVLRQLFARTHEQLDATIDMLDDAVDGDAAPSVPPA